MGIALMLVGCKKEGGSSAIEALLPKGAAAKLSSDLQIFAEELPGDVQAFGYVDFGQSVDAMTKSGMMGEYRGLYVDFAEMIQRRLGVDVQKVTGFGVIVYQKEPLFATVAPSTAPKAGELASDVMIGKLGRLTVVGEPAAVAALLAGAKQGKRLHETQPAWLRSALVHAGGNAAFATGRAESVLADAPPSAKAQLGDLTFATMTVGATGLGAYVGCKPGSVDKVKSLVEGGLAMARQLVAAQGSKLPQAQPGPMAAVLLRHYSEAFFKSLDQKVNGDELAVTLGWHAPALPAFQPAALGERVITPGEIGVAQLNFGAPVLQLMIAMSDVLKSPLDRAALHKELSAELAQMLGIEGFDPRAATLSASLAGFAVSLHNAPMGSPLATLPVPGDAAAAIATKWGVAMTKPSQAAQLLAAASTQGTPAAGLAEAKLLATEDEVFLRGYADLTTLPDMPIPGGISKPKSVALWIGSDHFSAEVLAAPGEGKKLVELIKTLPEKVAPGADEAYQNRKQGSIELEVMAIAQHYQRAQIQKYLTPKSVDGDRVAFEMKYERSQMRLMMAAAGMGVMAAVAIPAFLTYQLRSRRALDDLPQDPTDLPAMPDDAPMVEEPTTQQQQ